MSQSVPLRVIKVGGGLAAIAGALPAVAGALTRTAAAGGRLVVIPGGGPFADAVRDYDRVHGLSDDAAHWMAILAMDQFAHVLADHLPDARLAATLPDIEAAHAAGLIPILAPSAWLRRMDDLPHSWDVTSDSIAAYLATLIGADELVLVKPVRGGTELADPYFPRALAAGMRCRIIAVEEIGGLDAG